MNAPDQAFTPEQWSRGSEAPEPAGTAQAVDRLGSSSQEVTLRLRSVRWDLQDDARALVTRPLRASAKDR